MCMFLFVSWSKLKREIVRAYLMSRGETHHLFFFASSSCLMALLARHFDWLLQQPERRENRVEGLWSS